METNDVRTHLEEMLAPGDRIIVCKFVAMFVWESAAIQEVGLAKSDAGASGNRDLRRDSLCRNGFSGNGGLRVFELEVAAVLKAEFIDHRRSQGRHQARNHGIVFYKVVSKALFAAEYHTTRLNPRW